VASAARPGMNRPGACRVAAIELTHGPDKPGNSRVEVVHSGGGWLVGAAGRPRRDVDRDVRPQDSDRVSGQGKNMSRFANGGDIARSGGLRRSNTLL